MNLGMSVGFSLFIDHERLTFPAEMKVDWVRIYQYEEDMNIGCDPVSHPTNNYINALVTLLSPTSILTISVAFRRHIRIQISPLGLVQRKMEGTNNHGQETQESRHAHNDRTVNPHHDSLYGGR